MRFGFGGYGYVVWADQFKVIRSCSLLVVARSGGVRMNPITQQVQKWPESTTAQNVIPA